MCNQDHDIPALKLEGRVVEIFEEGGQRRVRLALQPHAVVDLFDASLTDLHLGDVIDLEADVVAIERRGESCHGHGHEHAHSHGGGKHP